MTNLDFKLYVKSVKVMESRHLMKFVVKVKAEFLSTTSNQLHDEDSTREDHKLLDSQVRSIILHTN